MMMLMMMMMMMMMLMMKFEVNIVYHNGMECEFLFRRPRAWRERGALSDSMMMMMMMMTTMV